MVIELLSWFYPNHNLNQTPRESEIIQRERKKFICDIRSSVRNVKSTVKNISNTIYGALMTQRYLLSL